MKNLIAFFLSLVLLGCYTNKTDNPVENTGPHPAEKVFARGADISWVTEMEKRGHKFYTVNGEEKDCFNLLKDYNLNAIRLRIWVDPSAYGNWCNIKDLVSKAKRARNAGMEVMVDFHYSDWWADPSKQYKPKAWEGLSLEELKTAFREHTREVLLALKAEGIRPKWVQIGNEITSGFLWDTNKDLSCASYDVEKNGKTYPENWANLGAFIGIGFQEVKSIFKDTYVIVHLDNGYDADLYDWYLDKLLANGGQWDIVGLSIYPYWAAQNKKGYKADAVINDCLQNIKHIIEKYRTHTMIVETGFECADDYGNLADEEVLLEGKRLLSKLISQCNSIPRCVGVIYWEPECTPSQYRLGAFTADGRPTVIMDGFLEN